MKRAKLLQHLARNECVLLREGSRHSIYLHQRNRQSAPVPRHADIDSVLVLKICKELGIDPPRER